MFSRTKIRYAIAAIVDNYGRIGVGSEWGPASSQSLTVESYVESKDTPQKVICDEIFLQYGLEFPSKALNLITHGDVDSTNYGVVKNTHLYVYHAKNKLVYKLHDYNTKTLCFMTLADINRKILDNNLVLSACAQKMLEFIQQRQNGLLKELF